MVKAYLVSFEVRSDDGWTTWQATDGVNRLSRKTIEAEDGLIISVPADAVITAIADTEGSSIQTFSSPEEY